VDESEADKTDADNRQHAGLGDGHIEKPAFCLSVDLTANALMVGGINKKALSDCCKLHSHRGDRWWANKNYLPAS
jgi:hypothetical protein